MSRIGFVIAICAALPAGCAPVTPQHDLAVLQKQVADTERGFAKTMADRDFAAFQSFVSEEAVFFSGTKTLRGKPQIAAAWKRFYEKRPAPFSWKPETVEVLESGTLALSSGPVRDSRGKLLGTFSSIWRLEAPGTWRTVFDKGCDACEACRKP